MSHIINKAVYPKRVSKKKVQEEWDEVARREDYQEGCSGLSSPIRWIDVLCKNIAEAEDYIDKHDNGWYDQLAVMFKQGRSIKWLVKTEYHV